MSGLLMEHFEGTGLATKDWHGTTKNRKRTSVLNDVKQSNTSMSSGLRKYLWHRYVASKWSHFDHFRLSPVISVWFHRCYWILCCLFSLLPSCILVLLTSPNLPSHLFCITFIDYPHLRLSISLRLHLIPIHKYQLCYLAISWSITEELT